MTVKEILRVAALARIEIDSEKLESFAGEFNKILEYFKKLNEAPVEEVESFTFEEKNVFRDDEPSFDTEVRERILKNAPERQDDFFKVRKVLE